MATILSCILLLKKAPCRLAVQAILTIDTQHRLNLNLLQVYNYRVLSINFNIFHDWSFSSDSNKKFQQCVCLSALIQLREYLLMNISLNGFFLFYIVISLLNIISLMNLRSRSVYNAFLPFKIHRKINQLKCNVYII